MPLVTVAQLRDRIRWLGDQQGARLRHRDPDIAVAIAQSYQRFRLKISDNGFHYYLVPVQGTLTVGPAAGYPFGLIDTTAWPGPRPLAVYGLDVVIDGIHRTLDAVDFRERTSFQSTFAGNAPPTSWSQYNDQGLVILPPPDAAYDYVAWILPVIGDAEPFDGKAGWEQWVVLDVLQQLLARDKKLTAVLGWVASELARVEADVLRASRHQQRSGPMVRRDTRGARRRNALAARWRVT